MYNAEAHVGACLDSILAQTYRDFELLVLDDGSTDDSLDVVASYSDERIRVIRCTHDFIRTLNRGLEESNGLYVARMDADDRMMPTRLERQVELMDSEPLVAVCATWADTYGDVFSRIGAGEGLQSHPLLSFLLGNFVIHPSVMMRKSFLDSRGIHYRPYPYAEDYKMWVEVCLAQGGIYVIPEALINYRVNQAQVSQQHRSEQTETAMGIQQEILDYLVSANSYRPHFIRVLYESLLEANQDDLVDGAQVSRIFYQIFMAIKDKPNAGIFLQKHNLSIL